MADTVRVRCAVGRDMDGKLAVLGFQDGQEREVIEWLNDWDCQDRLQWITVDIPLPVEPVVLAEVEGE